MPVKPCTINGKQGYKCGDEGKCYSISQYGKSGAWEKACSQCTAMGEKCSDSEYGCSKDKSLLSEGGDSVDIEKYRRTHIPIQMQKVGEQDERFLDVKIYVLHTGENYNGSIFEKETVDKAIPSLANTPILAFVEVEEDGTKDTAGHEIDIVIENGDFRMKYKGQAYGVIPENNNARWEKRIGDDGVEREYLVVDALLWTKFDDVYEIMTRDIIKGQSMELSENYSGHFNKDGIFVFDNFKFDGCAILGFGVEPAMNSASIELGFSTEKVKKDIQAMIKEFHAIYQKEVANVNIEQLLKDYGLTRQQVIDAGVEIHNYSEDDIEEFKQELERIKREENDNQDSNNDKQNQEDQKDFDKEDQEDQNKKSDGDNDEPKDSQKDNQEDQESNQDNNQENFEEQDGDQDDSNQDNQDGDQIENKNNQQENQDEDNQERYEQVKQELDELKKDYAKLKSKNDDLLTYKKNRQKDDHKAKVEALISSFEKLNENDVKEIREKIFHYTYDEIEEKLFAILGKKQAGDKVKKQSQFAKFYVHDEGEDNKPSYDHLFQKHLKK